MSTSSEPTPVAGRARWLALIVISLGVSLVVVDTTIVNVVLPSIITDLSITNVDAQWIQESYVIVIAALLLIMGRLTDTIGARRMFVRGSVLFGIASVLAAVAPTVELVISARVGQGIGGAMIMPASLALLNVTFSGPDRAKAFAIWGSTIGAAAAAGPLLGGLAGEISWRWAFGINIIVIAAILLGSRRYVTETPRSAGSLDLPGAALSVAGLGLLAFSIIEGRNHGWWSPITACACASVVLLGAFVIRQRRLTRLGGIPLMNTDVFRIRSFTTGNAASFVIGLAEFGILAVLPLWLQFTLGYSVIQTGSVIVAVAVGSFAASGASVGIAERVSPLGLVRLGLALEILGLLAVGLLTRTDSSAWLIVSVLFVYGMGIGFATAQVTNVVLAEVPPHLAGQGSGIQSTARQLGSALGIAIVTTVFLSQFAGELGPVTSAAGIESMTHALRVSALVCSALLVVGLAVTYAIPTTTHAASLPKSSRNISSRRDAVSGRGGVGGVEV